MQIREISIAVHVLEYNTLRAGLVQATRGSIYEDVFECLLAYRWVARVRFNAVKDHGTHAPSLVSHVLVQISFAAYCDVAKEHVRCRNDWARGMAEVCL